MNDNDGNSQNTSISDSTDYQNKPDYSDEFPDSTYANMDNGQTVLIGDLPISFEECDLEAVVTSLTGKYIVYTNFMSWKVI